MLLVPAVAEAKSIYFAGKLPGHPGSKVSLTVVKNKAGKPVKIKNVQISNFTITCDDGSAPAQKVSRGLGSSTLDRGRRIINKEVRGVSFNFSVTMTRKAGMVWGSVRAQTSPSCFGTSTFQIKPKKR